MVSIRPILADEAIKKKKGGGGNLVIFFYVHIVLMSCTMFFQVARKPEHYGA